MKHDNMKMTIHDSGETNARCECGWETTFPPGDESMEATLYDHGMPEPPFPKPPKYGLMEDAAQRATAAALQAVLDMHKPETRYESAGEWDLDGTYIPYCAHGSEWDHPDHVMIYGWWQCTTTPEQVCPYDSDGDDEAVWPCPTVEAIQRALTTPNYLEENDTLDPPM